MDDESAAHGANTIATNQFSGSLPLSLGVDGQGASSADDNEVGAQFTVVFQQQIDAAVDVDSVGDRYIPIRHIPGGFARSAPSGVGAGDEGVVGDRLHFRCQFAPIPAVREIGHLIRRQGRHRQQAQAQDDRHGERGRLFAQGVAFGQFGRKGVFAGGGRLREVPAGPGQGQLHRIGAAVHRGGDAGGQHRNHRGKIHGVFCADAGQGQHALVEVVRPDPLPGEDGLFRRVLGGIRFLRSISFLHGSGAGGQVRTLRRTDGTVRIDTVRRAKGLTGTFRRTFRFAAVRRVAEFAVRRVKGAGTSLGIAAGLIVDVRTVQFFCDAAAFLAAHMGTGVGCFFFALGREHPVAVTLRRMLMDTLGHEGVTIVGVFVGARRTLGITAGLIVHMMGAYGSPCFHIRSVHRCTGHGKHHGH